VVRRVVLGHAVRLSLCPTTRRIHEATDRWEDAGVDDYLPAATTLGGENETEPVAEATMGPLLVWAMHVVDDLAEDILAAWAERQRLTETARTSAATEAGAAALRAYLSPLVAPTRHCPPPSTRTRLDWLVATSVASPEPLPTRSRSSPSARGW
jgi:hypothetical protein